MAYELLHEVQDDQLCIHRVVCSGNLLGADVAVWIQSRSDCAECQISAIRARVAELEERREFASMQIDDLTDRVNNLIESRMEMRGKLAVAEKALGLLAGRAPLTFDGVRSIARNALSTTGTREARMLEMAECDPVIRCRVDHLQDCFHCHNLGCCDNLCRQARIVRAAEGHEAGWRVIRHGLASEEESKELAWHIGGGCTICAAVRGEVRGEVKDG